MKKLKLVLSVLLFVLVLAYAFAFSAHNSNHIELDFLIGKSFSLPVSIWLGVMLIIGALAGLMSGLISAARYRLKLRQLRKELADTKQRLNKLP